MPKLTIDVSQSLLEALDARAAQTGDSRRHIVSRALAAALDVDHATLFQVSTAGALVEGVYSEAVTVGDLRRHGDLGLGTFEGLDGEMVLLDGIVYRAHDDARISLPPESAAVPFAAVTVFRPEHRSSLAGIASMAGLTAALDRLRRSDNLFYAVRLSGAFSHLDVRVVCKVDEGFHLDEAVHGQTETRLDEVSGTLVGFWSPPYSKAIAIVGWHLHLLTDDRTRGGHLLDCATDGLEVQLHDLDEVHLAMPESAGFLRADLTRDPSAAIDVAEHASHPH